MLKGVHWNSWDWSVCYHISILWAIRKRGGMSNFNWGEHLKTWYIENNFGIKYFHDKSLKSHFLRGSYSTSNVKNFLTLNKWFREIVWECGRFVQSFIFAIQKSRVPNCGDTVTSSVPINNCTCGGTFYGWIG